MSKGALLKEQALLELYRIDKEKMHDVLSDPEYMSYRKWKAEYVAPEVADLLADGDVRTVTVEEAVNLADKEIEAADQVSKLPPIKEANEMANKPTKRSKIDKARAVMAQMVDDGKPRAAIIKRFCGKQIGLTPKGASTYYQKLKGEFGLAA